MAHANVEKILCGWLNGQLVARVVSERPADLADHLPLHVVERTPGGGETGYTTETVRITVDSYVGPDGQGNPRREEAWEEANRAREALTWELLGRHVSGVVFTEARNTLAPLQAPYDDSAIRRMTANYEFEVHATPS